MSCAESQIHYGRELQPWELRPFELVSWFQMLTYSAWSFFWCGNVLRGIRADCMIGACRPFGDDVAIALSADLDARARENATNSLSTVEKKFREIGLDITAETTKELATAVSDDTNRQNFQWLIDQVKSIENLAAKELKQRLFLYVPPERAKFWPKQHEPHPFGEAVRQSFPSAAFDIHYAAIALATSLSTASVFHQMRALESALSVLGKQFGIDLSHTNWNPTIEQIESKIREMHKDPTWKAKPDCKELQEFYAQAATHFAILKDAWRNYTMHARGKYTQDEAEQIFDTVKSFMQKLAAKLHE